MFADRWRAFRRSINLSFATPCLLALLVAQYFMATPLHDWMMDDATGDTSMNWQSHLSNELLEADASRNYQRLVESMRAALATLSLQQIDLFDEACQCAVSAKAFERADVEENAKIIENLLNGRLPNQSALGFGESPIPFDFAFVQDTHVHHEANHRLLDHGDHSHLVSNVDHVPLGSGRTIGIKLHMNVANAANAHFLMLVGLGVLVTTLSAIVLYSAERFMRRSHKAEEMSLEKAQFLAEHDPLTGFLNRYGFHTRSQRLLEQCRESGEKCHMIIYDADNFKEVNDQHGHDVGDRMLVAMAELLRASFPRDAIFGRLGGDEFAVCISSDSLWNDKDAFFAARSTELKIRLPEAGRDLETTISAGYSIFPDNGAEHETLMKAADLALLAVKQHAKSTIGAYDTAMTERFERRIWEIEGIRAAVATEGILAYYQPIVSSTTGRICLFEALARWKHPTEGILPPGAFQNALEDPVVSRLLTGAMLDCVVRDLKEWWARDLKIPVSLNLGQADLKQAELPDLLSAALDRYELPPTALLVEVTETAVSSSNLSEVLHILEEIRNRNIEISLDDFGTGTSSITLLRALPCSKLKIDKSFVDDVVSHGDDNAIVRALTRLGHDLNMNVVAEGVETQEQEAVLRKIGAEYLQGYLYSSPVPFDQVTGLVREHGFGHLNRPPFADLRASNFAS